MKTGHHNHRRKQVLLKKLDKIRDTDEERRQLASFRIWAQIVDYYAAALSLMYIAFFECVAVLWVYGVRRLAGNIKDMSGKYPSSFFTLCWRVISPLLIFVRSTYVIFEL